jgi:hypothetical protein
MAIKLNKPLIRDTGLVRDDKLVFVVLVPTDDGGVLAFKQKGKHGKGAEVSLSKVLDELNGDVRKSEPPVAKKKATPEIDRVDLAALEARIMIDGQDIMTPAVKGRLFAIVREMREERREDEGMTPVLRGASREK